MNPLGIDRSLDRYSRIRSTGLAPLLILSVLSAAGIMLSWQAELPAQDPEGTCGEKYIAAGDHYPAGHEVSESERYPHQLLSQPYRPDRHAHGGVGRRRPGRSGHG